VYISDAMLPSCLKYSIFKKKLKNDNKKIQKEKGYLTGLFVYLWANPCIPSPSNFTTIYKACPNSI